MHIPISLVSCSFKAAAVNLAQMKEVVCSLPLLINLFFVDLCLDSFGSIIKAEDAKSKKICSTTGLKTPPPILKKTVGMMGLKGVPGLNITSSLDKPGGNSNHNNAGKGNRPTSPNKGNSFGQSRVSDTSHEAHASLSI